MGLVRFSFGRSRAGLLVYACDERHEIEVLKIGNTFSKAASTLNINSIAFHVIFSSINSFIVFIQSFDFRFFVSATFLLLPPLCVAPPIGASAVKPILPATHEVARRRPNKTWP